MFYYSSICPERRRGGIATPYRAQRGPLGGAERPLALSEQGVEGLEHVSARTPSGIVDKQVLLRRSIARKNLFVITLVPRGRSDYFLTRFQNNIFLEDFAGQKRFGYRVRFG